MRQVLSRAQECARNGTFLALLLEASVCSWGADYGYPQLVIQCLRRKQLVCPTLGPRLGAPTSSEGRVPMKLLVTMISVRMSLGSSPHPPLNWKVSQATSPHYYWPLPPDTRGGTLCTSISS